MTFQEFRDIVENQYARGNTRLVVPVYRRLSADLLTPVSAFLAFRKNSTYSFLLESVEGGEKLGRYSFLGRNPYLVVSAHGESVRTEDFRSGDRTETTERIFDVLGRLVSAYTEVKLPGLPRFASGAVGYMGYDTVRLLEHLPAPPPDQLGLPEAVWCFYDLVVAFDHVKHQLVLMASAFIEPNTDLEAAYEAARARIAEAEQSLAEPPEHPEPIAVQTNGLRSNFTREAFGAAVERARRYIYEGDIFQVVLSQRFEVGFRGDRFNLYRALRQVNPSPYLFYLNMGDYALIGSSPEVLVRVESGRAEVLPIAGTRARGETEQQDLELEAELLADPKERAEHLMLVDLGRNDLGRVCSFGSVAVDRYAFIERYSHVMHIVSSVSGTVQPGISPVEVLGATFPAGTVSGAPKVRAMQIIDELEPGKRGIYAGAVGYVDFSGNLDSCIAIRTMVARDDRVYIQAGAGIVADSDPEREYEETVNKARALHQALQVASEGLL